MPFGRVSWSSFLAAHQLGSVSSKEKKKANKGVMHLVIHLTCLRPCITVCLEVDL